MNNIRYAFFGTPQFAALILEDLVAAGFLPEIVICNPDEPFGRKKIITPPPVKQYIMQQVESIRKKIKIFQPQNIKELTTNPLLHTTPYDFFLVVAYGKIIPKSILDMPRLGTIGIHPSLLPAFRGPSPIQTAILEGVEETGVTIFMVDERVDHGPIVVSKSLKVENKDTYETLHNKLAKLGAELCIEILPKFASGAINAIPQNEHEATFTKKFMTDDARVDLEYDDPGIVWRKVRALNPEPGVFTLSPSKGGSKRMKILEADLVEGKLVLKKIQFEGKKPQAI